jgi:hypothetical protein
MGERYAVCSIRPPAEKDSPNVSAPIMIPCFGSTNGKRSVPVSHPFIERLIGTIRREYLDHLLFWNESDLVRKLEAFKEYYNGFRIHQSLNQQPPEEAAGKDSPPPADPMHFVWQAHCQGLFYTPRAA